LYLYGDACIYLRDFIHNSQFIEKLCTPQEQQQQQLEKREAETNAENS